MRNDHFSIFLEPFHVQIAMPKMIVKRQLKRSKAIRPYGPYRVGYGPERPITMRSRSSYGSYGAVFPELFPEKKKVCLTFCSQDLLTPAGVGQGDIHTYRANSIFDPDYTGVGHQPRFRDVLAGIYERYAVESSTIEVTFWTAGSSSSGQCNVYVTTRPTVNDEPSVLSQWDTIEENGSIKTKPLGARDGGTDVTKIVAKYSTKQMFGASAMQEDDLSALFGSNPSKSPIFVVGMCPINTADIIGSIRFTVKLKFNLIAYRRKHDLGQD